MKNFKYSDFQRYLVEIGIDTLSLENISEESYIHTLSLDSMAILEVFFMIEEDYDIKIPLTIINKDTTINKLIHDINELLS